MAAEAVAQTRMRPTVSSLPLSLSSLSLLSLFPLLLSSSLSLSFISLNNNNNNDENNNNDNNHSNNYDDDDYYYD